MRKTGLTFIIFSTIVIALCFLGLRPYEVYAGESISCTGTINSDGSLDEATINSVSSDLRNRLKLREENITYDIKVNSLPDDPQTIAQAIYDKAMMHTGVPNEGDYLKWNVKSEGWVATTQSNSTGKHLQLTYTVQFYTTKAQEDEVTDKANRIIAFLDLDGKTDYEKIHAIYSYVCTNVEYDWEQYISLDLNPGTQGTNPISQSAYGAFCNNLAVCQGYTTMLYRLLLMAGIDNRVVTGALSDESNSLHVWNIIKLGDVYYEADATHDAGQVKLKKFLKSASDFSDRGVIVEWLPDEYSRVSKVAYCVEADLLTAKYNGFVYGPSLDYIKILSYVGNEKNVIVPSTIDGVHVKGIGQQAFHANFNIESLTISEGVEFVACMWVSGCESLKEIILPSTVEMRSQSLGGVFDTGINSFLNDCRSLERIEIPTSNPYLCVIDGVLYNAEKTAILCYPSSSKEKIISIPDGVTFVTGFAGNSYLEEVILPESVIKIDYWAFSGCVSLKKINIPQNCSFIGQYAFEYTAIQTIVFPKDFIGQVMDGLFNGTSVEVIVEEGNQKFRIENGCLIEYNFEIVSRSLCKCFSSDTVISYRNIASSSEQHSLKPLCAR